MSNAQMNRLPINESSNLKLTGLIITFLLALTFIGSNLYFFMYLPLMVPSSCKVPKLTANYYVVPMFLPSSSADTIDDESLTIDKVQLTANVTHHTVQEYVLFAGLSEYAYKYRLLKFSTSKLKSKVYRPTSQKNIVLFIPGHAGNYGQVRSLAAAATKQNPKFSSILDWDIPDYYTIDFNGELSGFSSKTVHSQSVFVLDSIKTLLNLYNFERYEILTAENFNIESFSDEYTINDQNKLVIIAHSMGGFVSRAMTLLPEFNNIAQNIQAVVSLSSPAIAPIMTHDYNLNRKYYEVNSYFKQLKELTNRENSGKVEIYEKEYNALTQYALERFNSSLKYRGVEEINSLNQISFISVNAGRRDVMVPTRFSPVDNIHSLGLSINLDEIRRLGIHGGTDHLSILWCKRFLDELSQAVFAALIPNYRERSNNKGYVDGASIRWKKEEEKELTEPIKKRIIKACHDSKTFSPNDKCSEQLFDFFDENHDNYNSILTLLMFNKHIGFGIPESVSLMTILKRLHSLVIFTTPSYLVLISLLSLLTYLKFRIATPSFNIMTYLKLYIKSNSFARFLGLFGFLCVYSVLRSSSSSFLLISDNLSFISFEERIFYLVSLTGCLQFILTGFDGLGIVFESIRSLLSLSEDTQKNIKISLPYILLSISASISYEFYNKVFNQIFIKFTPYSTISITFHLLLITLSLFILLNSALNLLISRDFINSLLYLLSLVCLLPLLAPLSELYQIYTFFYDIDTSFLLLFPHRSVSSLTEGNLKRIEGPLNELMKVQENLFQTYLKAFERELFCADQLRYIVLYLCLILPLALYFFLTANQVSVEWQRNKRSISRGPWRLAMAKKTKKKKKKKKEEKKKGESGIVEGEVIERDGKEIVLLNDTEYISKSEVILSNSSQESVQIDSVENNETDGQEVDGKVPLFKEVKENEIHYRKVEVTLTQYKESIVILNEKYSISTYLETLVPLLFFWGPLQTWLILPTISFLFLLLDSVLIFHSNDLKTVRNNSKIEYKR